MLISDIRRKNARALIAQIDGPAEFGRKLEMSDSQVSQLTGENFTKNIGNTIARRIEAAFGKPAGWMDVDQETAATVGIEGRRVISHGPENNNFIEIKRVKLKLSAGLTGFGAEPDSDEGRPISFRQDWFDKYGFVPERLLAVGVRGESMEPTMSDSDTVVINTADTKLKDGKIYAVNFDGEAVIKRLVNDYGRWFLVSDNPDQKRYHRQECSGATCIIIGQVVLIQRMTM